MSTASITTFPAPAGLRRRRLLGALTAHPAATIAGAVLLVASIGLIATHRTVALPLSRAAAIARVEAFPHEAALLANSHFSRVTVTPVDSHQEIVWYYAGPHLVASFVVPVHGPITFAINYSRLNYAYGSTIANSSRMLELLAVLFVLMTAVWPLWRLRNLDVLAILSTTLSIVLLNSETPEREMLVTAPILLYLAVRCGWRALGPGRPPAPATPLYEQLTARCTTKTRLRILRIVAIACALIVVMVGYSSAGVVDVAYAVMEGATAILHGLLPYGHIPGVLHGDTYPFGSYLLYVPFAAITPVTNVFDFPQWALNVAILAAVAVGVGLWRAARKPYARSARHTAPGHEAAGLRLAIAWLTFPPLLVTVSTGTTDVVLAAILLAAVLLWHRPSISVTILAAGCWFKLYPVALVPLALASARGRSLIRTLIGPLLTSLAMVGGLVWIGGFGALSEMLHAMSYQLSRTDPHSIWAWVGGVPLQQLAQAATLAMIGGTAVRIWRDRALARDRVRLAAASGAILLGLQISSGYWTYLYLAWVFPFLALSVLSDTNERDRSEAPPSGAVVSR